MKKNYFVKTLLSGLILIGTLGISLTVKAKTVDDPVAGSLYEFEKNGNYAISPNTTNYPIESSGTVYGLFSVEGNLTKTKSINGITAYEVESGNAMLKYTINEDFFKESESNRYVVNEKKKKVYDEKLASKIGSGAVLLQTSQDGEKWYYWFLEY